MARGRSQRFSRLAAVQRLKARGVRFLAQPHETPVCHLVTIADPDGHLLLIHQRKRT
ncbi:MAG TPA: VOC family protein [Opitutaceae bacterium]|nr:VOC family protein [Opitutaceae bacterium]